ncbi:hypothetical protein OG696_02450 [Streptomyces sp. NBC_00656]|uniref:hypothetical protein n=1 Tax=Streptomyces sp. NBC_00656 TaxID=2903668 RepID=UPI0032515A30
MIHINEEDWFEPEDTAILIEPMTYCVLMSENLIKKTITLVSGVQWEIFDEVPALRRIVSARRLPEPIIIPGASKRTQGETGMWYVEGDGREILSQRNLDFLKKHGIAFTSECLADGILLTRPAVPVFSGQVVSSILDSDAMGLDGSPSYLFIENS